MKKRRLILVAVLVSIAGIVAGCLTTGTVVVTARLSPDSTGSAIQISSDLTEELEVNLGENATFKDYQDDIRNIDNIGFCMIVTNNFFTDATFQLFFEPDTSANYDSVQVMLDEFVELILTDIIIPARATTTIEWNESMKYITNLQEFKSVLEGGIFSIYPAAIPRDNFNLTIDSLVVIVTLSGSK
jgi:hypothetical protein